MDHNKLFTPGPPAYYVTTADDSDFENLYLQLIISHKEAIIRKIRGHKCRTVDRFFSEVGAALQFPWYFGENWAAFDECINDLDWMESRAYLLLVSSANLLLNEAHIADFGTLLRILADANVDWLTPNKYGPRDRPVTAFHVVFQCPASDLESFSHRMVQAGIKPERL